jgi:hypothetical protein
VKKIPKKNTNDWDGVMPPGSFAQKLKLITRSKEDLVFMPHARVGAGHQDIQGPMQWGYRSRG